MEEKVVETIFHGALSRVAPLVVPRARLILAGETEDKGERAKRKKRKRKIINDDRGRREIFSTDVEELYYRPVFRFLPAIIL